MTYFFSMAGHTVLITHTRARMGWWLARKKKESTHLFQISSEKRYEASRPGLVYPLLFLVDVTGRSTVVLYITLCILYLF